MPRPLDSHAPSPTRAQRPPTALQQAFGDERLTWSAARAAYFMQRRTENRYPHLVCAIYRLMEIEAAAETLHHIATNLLAAAWDRASRQMPPKGPLTDADAFRADTSPAEAEDYVAALLARNVIADPDDVIPSADPRDVIASTVLRPRRAIPLQ